MTTFGRHGQIHSRGAQSITTATRMRDPEGMRIKRIPKPVSTGVENARGLHKLLREGS